MGIHDPNADVSPFKPVPPVVWGMVALIGVFELAFQAGAAGLIGGPRAVGWRAQGVEVFAFHQAIWARFVETWVWRLDEIWRLLTYPLVHQGAVHAGFAAVLILALGNAASKVFAPVALVSVVLAATAVGAVVFGLTSTPGEILIGAYPAVYGLLGLYTWSLWRMAEVLGTNKYAAFRLVGVLVAIQILFILVDGRWTSFFAELGGFAVGFALAAPAAPGGVRRLRERLRGRS